MGCCFYSAAISTSNYIENQTTRRKRETRVIYWYLNDSNARRHCRFMLKVSRQFETSRCCGFLFFFSSFLCICSVSSFLPFRFVDGHVCFSSTGSLIIPQKNNIFLLLLWRFGVGRQATAAVEKCSFHPPLLSPFEIRIDVSVHWRRSSVYQVSAISLSFSKFLSLFLSFSLSLSLSLCLSVSLSLSLCLCLSLSFPLPTCSSTSLQLNISLFLKGKNRLLLGTQ